MSLPESYKLYLILDTEVLPHERLLAVAKEAISYGVDIFQLRDKTSTKDKIRGFIDKFREQIGTDVTLILNDFVDIAKDANMGVHVGQEDTSVEEARKAFGEKFWIGASCQTLQQAIKAQEQGADYIGFGSVFKTLTKPNRESMDLDLLRNVIHKIKIPVLAIGGINHENISTLVNLGILRVAVTRHILLAQDVRLATRQLKENLMRNFVF